MWQEWWRFLILLNGEIVSLWDDFVGVACFKIWLKCGKSWNFVFCLTSSLKGERNKESAFCWLCRKKWINMQMINPKIKIMHKNMKYMYHMICIKIIKKGYIKIGWVLLQKAFAAIWIKMDQKGLTTANNRLKGVKCSVLDQKYLFFVTKKDGPHPHNQFRGYISPRLNGKNAPNSFRIASWIMKLWCLQKNIALSLFQLVLYFSG